MQSYHAPRPPEDANLNPGATPKAKNHHMAGLDMKKELLRARLRAKVLTSKAYSLLGLFYAKKSTSQKKKKAPHAIPNRLEVIHTNVSDWLYFYK